MFLVFLSGTKEGKDEDYILWRLKVWERRVKVAEDVIHHQVRWALHRRVTTTYLAATLKLSLALKNESLLS